MTPLAKTLIAEVVEKEGGYSNHPSDRGGETNYGITKAVAREAGYLGPMRDLPKELAEDIYYRVYWREPGFERVAEEGFERIAAELFDSGVNCGVSRASKWLQRSLNILNGRGTHYGDLPVTGRVGLLTIAALKAYRDRRPPINLAELILLRALEGFQISHYIHLCETNQSQEDFIVGWLRTRVGLA